MKHLLAAFLLLVSVSVNAAEVNCPLPYFCIPAPPPKQTSTPQSITNKDVITLYGKIDGASAAAVINQIHAKQHEGTKLQPLYLVIDSPGGEVQAGLRIIDAIQQSKRPIITVDVGLAASMAAYIFEHGHARMMNPHSTLMFHLASMGMASDLGRLDSQLQYTLKVMRGLNQQVATRSGIPLDEFEKRIIQEWWVLPEEASQSKLVDSINVGFNDYPASTE